MSRKFHPSPEDFLTVSLRTLATETGMTRRRAKAYLKANSWWAGRYFRDNGYDAHLIDLIHALHGRPHRALTVSESDWVSDFLRGGPPHGN